MICDSAHPGCRNEGPRRGGGYVAIVLEGDVAAVEAAVAAGRKVAESFDALIATEIISRPSEGVGRSLATCALTEEHRG